MVWEKKRPKPIFTKRALLRTGWLGHYSGINDDNWDELIGCHRNVIHYPMILDIMVDNAETKSSWINILQYTGIIGSFVDFSYRSHDDGGYSSNPSNGTNGIFPDQMNSIAFFRIIDSCLMNQNESQWIHENDGCWIGTSDFPIFQQYK